MNYQFSPSSWHNGSRSLDTTAQQFASQASGILGRLMSVADTVPMASTQADAAVAQILMAVGSAGQRTDAGIAHGLSSEARLMRETNNESIASRVGE